MGLTIRDLYRFWIDLPGVGLVQFYPQNASLKWVDALKTGYRFHQRTLDDKLVFMDIPGDGINDFTKLYNLERMGMTCEKVNIFVDEYCPCDSTWTVNFYKGYLRLSQGDWNVSRCRASIPVVVQDAYTCVTTRWTKEDNFFNFGDPPIEVTPLVGVVQFEACKSNGEHTWNHIPPIEEVKAWLRQKQWELSSYQTQCLPDLINPPSNHPWTLLGQGIIADIHLIPADIFHPHDRLRLSYTIRSRWAREFFAGPTAPPGTWYPATGGWQRPLYITNGPVWDYNTPEGHQAIANYFNNDDWDIGYLSEFLLVGLDGSGNTILTNGKELGPILEDWFALCGLTVVSNFYNINPDGSNPSNKYYDNAAVDAVGLVLFQVTDLARLDELQSATKMEAAMKEAIDTLKWMFNTDITIDGTVVRFEHLSYFSRIVTLDLTLPDFVKWIKGAWAYTYDEATLPLRENFKFSRPTDYEGGDFDGYPIEYNNACVNDRDDQPETTFATTKFLTNLKNIFGNPDLYDSKEIVIVATDGNGTVLFADQPISGHAAINGNLALGYLLDRYHDYARPFKRGIINKKPERPFYATIEQRKQVPFTIPFQCDDYLHNFDPSGKVKTQLGAGLITKATREVPVNSLTLELKHK